jgi:hypothetical protein
MEKKSGAGKSTLYEIPQFLLQFEQIHIVYQYERFSFIYWIVNYIFFWFSIQMNFQVDINLLRHVITPGAKACLTKFEVKYLCKFNDATKVLQVAS